MANEINRIGFNTGSVNGYDNASKGENKPEDTVKEIPPMAAPPQIQVTADDVFTYMTYNAIGINPSTPKNYNISKYVTPEQAERIAGFVASFEGEVARALKAIEDEGINLPEDQKYVVAASMVTK